MKPVSRAFQPNVDLMKAFQSRIMLVNDMKDTENGMVFHRAGADGPPIHAHPDQDEIIRVVEGELEVYRKDQWLVLKAGDSVTIPKKTAHSYRSRHTEDCLFEYELTPVRRFSEMMRSFERLQNEGKLKGTDLRSVIYLSMSFKKYRDQVISVSPPDFVIQVMAGIGRLTGFKI